MFRLARSSSVPGRARTWPSARLTPVSHVARSHVARWGGRLLVLCAVLAVAGCSSLDGAVDSHRRPAYDRPIRHVHVATSVSADLTAFRDHLTEACIRSLAAHDVAVETSSLDWRPETTADAGASGPPLPVDQARREGATSLLVITETSRGVAERSHRSPGWGYAEPSIEQVVVLDARLYDLSEDDASTPDPSTSGPVPVWRARVTTRSHPLEAADEAALTTAAQLTSALQADGLLSPMVTYRD